MVTAFPPVQPCKTSPAGGLDFGLIALHCLVRQQPALVETALKVGADPDDAWWRSPPHALLHTVAVTVHGPKGAASLQSAADANSLSGETGQRRTLDLHILE